MDPGRRLGGGGFYTKGRTSVHVSSPSHGRVYYARVPRLLMREPGRVGREGGFARVRLCCRESWKGRVVAS